MEIEDIWHTTKTYLVFLKTDNITLEVPVYVKDNSISFNGRGFSDDPKRFVVDLTRDMEEFIANELLKRDELRVRHTVNPFNILYSSEKGKKK